MTVSSVRLPDDLAARFDELAERTGRSRNYLMVEALREYIEHEALWLGRVQEGIDQADRGEFVPDDEMEAFWAERSASEGMAHARREALAEYGLTE
jgi:predicted transcriptional regulator